MDRVPPVVNRSFLHHGNQRLSSSSPSSSPRKLVSSTVDSLALKRTRLPLRLVRTTDANYESLGSSTRDPNSQDQGNQRSKPNEAVSEVSNVKEIRVDGLFRSSENSTPQEYDDVSSHRNYKNELRTVGEVQINDSSTSENNNSPHIETREKKRKKKKKENMKEKKKKKRKKVMIKKRFAKSVLHFVPTRLAIDPKKTRSTRKFRSVKRTASLESSSSATISETEVVRHRGYPILRGENRRSPNISSPTNFVHIASGSSGYLACLPEEIASARKKPIITYGEKCATLPLLGRKCKRQTHETSKSNENERWFKEDYSSVQPDLKLGNSTANSSFLWSYRINRVEPIDSSELTTDTGDYDDVEPVPFFATEVVSDYDDVEYPVPLTKGESNARVSVISSFIDSENKENSDGAIYDDVVTIMANSSSPPDTSIKIFAPQPNGNSNLSSENEYSSVDEQQTKQVEIPAAGKFQQGSKRETEEPGDSYDDVLILCEEDRVNSLYWESSTDINVTRTQESDWEDYGVHSEPSSLESFASNEQSGLDVQNQSGVPRRAPARTYYPGSARRRRSKRFLKRSRTRSSKKASLHQQKKDASDGSTYESVDFQSAGTGTGGLVESDDDTGSEISHGDDIGGNSHRHRRRRADLLVQTDSPSLTGNPEVLAGLDEGGAPLRETHAEAPYKPIPAPPREASLTQTLTKRIRMLRRTWSITKESIGRMRRRTSPDIEQPSEESKLYFGLSRHFRRISTTTIPVGSPGAEAADSTSVQSSRTPESSSNSTFYLEYSNIGNNTAVDTSNRLRKFNESHSQEGQTEPSYVNLNHGPGSRPVSQNDRYSSLAEQEPLYQFYAAAAARGCYNGDSNSDSISDGYEEAQNTEAMLNRSNVEKSGLSTTTSTGTTVEFAKPGHRTLWCETPRVKASGLLDKLTTEERKIQEAKFEILTSEASYVSSLRVLQSEFAKDPLFSEHVLSSLEKDKLFGSVPRVLQTAEKFFADLESLWRSDPMLDGLSDVLFKHASTYFDVYVDYCSNQVSIDTALRDLRARKGSQFVEIVSRIEARPSCQSLSLHSFLMLPMQRITRLPLLTDAVLSRLPPQHPERQSWEKVLCSVSNIVVKCNEAARAAAQEAEIELLAKKLEYSEGIEPITFKGKRIVKSGRVTRFLTKSDTEYKLTFGKKFAKSSIHLFLLTDYLLIGKRRTNLQEETYLITDTCKRSLITLEKVPDDASLFGARNSMLLTLLENHSGRQAEYLLACDSNTARERWLEAASPSERGQIGESLYESWDCPQVVAIYPYTPCQSDELPLQPGEVINVLKKMPDGWYQGEKLLDGEQGWFPGNYTKEIDSEHVRARNLKQRHRFLAATGSTFARCAR